MRGSDKLERMRAASITSGPEADRYNSGNRNDLKAGFPQPSFAFLPSPPFFLQQRIECSQCLCMFASETNFY